MTVDNIIALARTLTNTDSTQVSDADALKYLNIVYQDLSNRIMSDIDEGYFWEEYKTDTVVSQSEYRLQLASATTEGLQKLTSIEIKYKSANTYRGVIRADTVRNYDKSDDWLKANASTMTPFYEVKDESIFIYPAPTEAVTEGLRACGITTNIDLISGGAETTIFPGATNLRAYHPLLAVGMKQYIFAERRLDADKNDSINEYESKAVRMIQSLRDRISLPMEQQLPNSTYFKY